MSETKEYKNLVVKKPWGHEYLAYENSEIALWCLYIEGGQQTSFHCHPTKTTGLIVLNGEADVSFFDNTYRISPGRKIMIRKGLFHSTKAISENGAWVFEVETPKNKHDLVRLEDRYGRETKPYEGKSFETPKDKLCLWIEDPSPRTLASYDFKGCKINVERTDDINVIKTKNDSDNILFLKGGILAKDHTVARSGDIVAASTAKKLLGSFPTLHPETVLMTITHGS